MRTLSAALATALLVTACAPGTAPELREPLRVFGTRGHGEGALFRPTGIAVSPAGEVFVADTGNHRVQVFSREGRFLRTLGGPGEASGRFRRPMDLALTPEGHLLVAEFGGDRVQELAPDGRWLRTWRGEDAGAGPFDGAAGVGVSAAGDLYVADFYHHRVVHLGPGGTLVGVLGRPGRVLPGRLHYPTDVSVRGGLVVVADAYNHRIQAFDHRGEVRFRIGGPLGAGIPGGLPGWFRVATGIALDRRGRLLAADFDNHRVQVFDEEHRVVAVFGGHGSEPGRFVHPTDLDVDASGHIYVVDFGNHRIQVFAPVAERSE